MNSANIDFGFTDIDRKLAHYKATFSLVTMGINTVIKPVRKRTKEPTNQLNVLF